MSQMIADLFHRKPLGKKMSRTRVAQRMGPMMPNGRLERTQPFADRFPKRRAAQRTIGSMQREKDMTGRMVQPHFLQITQDRLAYRLRQRILLSPPRLWSNNMEDLPVPVQVFQLQTLHLFRSKSVDNKQHQNGPVTDIDGTVAHRTCEQLLNDLPRWSRRKQLMLIDNRRHDGCRQPRPTPTLRFRVSEKRPKLVGVKLDAGAPAMILASLLRNRFVDLPDRDGCQSAIRAVAAEELPDMAALTANGHGRKTFLVFHILGELVDETLILRNAWPLQSAQKT